MAVRKRKPAPAVQGELVKLATLGEKDRGRMVVTPDGRRWRCAWPMYGLGGLKGGLVDGWFLRELLDDGREGRDVVWHRGGVPVVVEAAPLVAEEPGGELDPLQVFA